MAGVWLLEVRIMAIGLAVVLNSVGANSKIDNKVRLKGLRNELLPLPSRTLSQAAKAISSSSPDYCSR